MRRVVMALCVFLPVFVQAQSPSVVGAWRLVSYERPDSSGGRRPVWGGKPLGLIVYVANGTMSAHGFDDRRASFQATATRDGVAAARAAAYAGLFAYYGTYVVDTVSRQVRHQVEGAWNPDWIGSTVVRAYRFLDRDHLELRVVRNPDGRIQADGDVLVWERLKP